MKKEKATKVKKIGRPYKDFIPANVKAPREQVIPKNIENFNHESQPLAYPYPLFLEWPGNEEAKVT